MPFVTRKPNSPISGSSSNFPIGKERKKKESKELASWNLVLEPSQAMTNSRERAGGYGVKRGLVFRDMEVVHTKHNNKICFFSSMFRNERARDLWFM